MADMVAGSVGFTWIWNPKAGQLGNIPSLIGLTCTMTVLQLDTGYRRVFSMVVSPAGLTASYTTQSPNDFPVGNPPKYLFEFTASNGSNIIVSSIPVMREIASPI